ncbi:CZB domain-containing protein [Celeribacter sp. PS-C1]|uniref:CZB domain-containing protein n=1 Tax=Celeribacter sp. PS-C1 TaxID=2820813 RepID=UPI00351CF55E
MNSSEITGDAQIRDAICAHAAWKRTLLNGIERGQLEKSAEEISCNDQCAFGKWLGGLTPKPSDQTTQKFEMIENLHTRFHQAAGKIALEVEKGNREAAKALFEAPQFRRMTNSLILNLNDWREDFRKML